MCEGSFSDDFTTRIHGCLCTRICTTTHVAIAYGYKTTRNQMTSLPKSIVEGPKEAW